MIIALGKPVDNLGEVSLSFRAALEQLPRVFLFGGPILEAIDRTPVSLILPRPERVGEILAQNNREALVELFEDIKAAFRESTLSLDDVQLELNRLSESIKSIMERENGLPQRSDILNPHISRFNFLADMFTCWINDIVLFYGRRDKSREDVNNRIIEEIKEYIGRNYREEISLGDLSEKFAVSYSHLSKMFHDFSGVTFRQYLNTYRLEQAAAMLTESRLTVKEIAYETGFSDTGYFIKRFKRRYGATPSSYRRGSADS